MIVLLSDQNIVKIRTPDQSEFLIDKQPGRINSWFIIIIIIRLFGWLAHCCSIVSFNNYQRYYFLTHCFETSCGKKLIYFIFYFILIWEYFLTSVLWRRLWSSYKQSKCQLVLILCKEQVTNQSHIKVHLAAVTGLSIIWIPWSSSADEVSPAVTELFFRSTFRNSRPCRF